MASAPIQVILNPDNFRRKRVGRPPIGNGTDFFEGRDEAFTQHRQRMQDQVQAVRHQLSRQDDVEIGYLKVGMSANALAKSHRPVEALFRAELTPIRGGGRLGELITEVTPYRLAQVAAAISRAETEVGMKPKKKGASEMVPNPTRFRCEVSALEQLELWGRSDRRSFDIGEAIRWLSDPRTGQAYIVELFERPPADFERDELSLPKRSLFDSFEHGLRRLAPGLVVRLREGAADSGAVVEVLATKSSRASAIFVPNRAALDSQTFDPDPDRHRALIGFLEDHPLVRQITLPSIAVRSTPVRREASPVTGAAPAPAVIPRDPDAFYPIVGVIDGGVSAAFAPWVVDRWTLINEVDWNLAHGTFIAGLLIEGSALNPQLSIGADGCLIADINIYPDERRHGAFASYFFNGSEGFLEEIGHAVRAMRQAFGVRIFNLSISFVSLVRQNRYSLEARDLDRIAEENDVIFVFSAGNLLAENQRREWPGDPAQALKILAARQDDRMYVPAESLRNISVAAINPDGLSNSLGGAPARYSRRGPLLKTGVKPDLCHVGGSGTLCPTGGHGLHSRDADGKLVSGCGTSYAAPLVARHLAALDAMIAGSPTRETLIALALHHARLPAILHDDAFYGLARQFVGFGTPASAAEALDGHEHQITLLFANRIFTGQSLVFDFSWPPSLVHSGGKCRGDIQLTIVSAPTINYDFGDELVRVNIEAVLQQEDGIGHYGSCGLEPTYVSFNSDEKTREAGLIEHMFKWSPVKMFAKTFPKGIGESSNWRLKVDYLLRTDEQLPDDGIPLAILLTIADPDCQKPVFQEMRQLLQATNYKIADIRTAARVTPRV